MKSKKYAMGGMTEGEDSPMAPKTSMRPKPRPMGLQSAMAPKTSMRPKPRPAAMDMSEEDRAALERMGRSMQRESEEAKDMGLKKGGMARGKHKMPNGTMMKDSEHKMKHGGKVKKMKSGGKVRGYGMARGGKACKMS
jgi:hypothetical protein